MVCNEAKYSLFLLLPSLEELFPNKTTFVDGFLYLLSPSYSVMMLEEMCLSGLTPVVCGKIYKQTLSCEGLVSNSFIWESDTEG